MIPKKEIYTDGLVKISRLDARTINYEFDFSKLDNNQIILSKFLQYFSWQFEYMSKYALLDLIEGSYELCKGGVDKRTRKFLDRISEYKHEDIIQSAWNIILAGEGQMFLK